MKLLVDLWVAVNMFSFTITLMIMMRTTYRIVPMLKERGSWQHETVRAVVAAYRRRDFNRLMRVTLYLVAGLVSLSPGPLHQQNLVEIVVSMALVLGVLNECWDAISDYRYRNAWFSPL